VEWENYTMFATPSLFENDTSGLKSQSGSKNTENLL